MLSSKSVSIEEIIQNRSTPTTVNLVFEEVIGNVALQIGIIEVFKKVELTVDLAIGYGIGEFACGYFDNCLTLEEAVSMSFVFGKLLEMVNKPTITLVLRGNVKEVKLILLL